MLAGLLKGRDSLKEEHGKGSMKSLHSYNYPQVYGLEKKKKRNEDSIS